MPLSKEDLDQIQAIITTSLNEFENKFKTIISEECDKKLAPILTDLNDFKEEMRGKYNSQQELIVGLQDDIATLHHEKERHLDKLNKQERLLVMQKINHLQLEIHHRKYNMIATNIADSGTDETNSQLIEKFKGVLKDVVGLSGELVNNMTFKAAHRLGKTEVGSTKPRSAIFVFEKLDDISAAWGKIRKLGKSPYNFKTHLPPELAQYRTDLLLERETSKKNRAAIIRVGEEKGFPYLDEKLEGRWVRQKHYMDQYAHFNIKIK